VDLVAEERPGKRGEAGEVALQCRGQRFSPRSSP
jgi:hypothetical protein